jgi:hypothetical protein
MKKFKNVALATTLIGGLVLNGTYATAAKNMKDAEITYQFQLNAEYTVFYNTPNQNHYAGILAPQTVKVIKELPTGWKKIETSIGEKWINPELPHPTVKINKVTSIYDQPKATTSIGSLSPQEVLVLHERGNGWVQINTWLGAKWVFIGE